MAQLVPIEEALDLLDEQGDGWKNYRVNYAPRTGNNGWEISNFSISRLDDHRIDLIVDGGMDRDPGWGDGFTKITKNGDVWMSDTRAEIMEHSPLFNKLWWCEPLAEKQNLTLLVNGLGLGMAVHGALFHKVAHIDVVEIDQDVIDLVAPLLDPEKVTVHQGDALTMTWPRGKTWDFAWHDIWPTITPGNLPQMQALHKKYQKKVAWQDSWQRKGCVKMKRIEKKFMEALRAGDWDLVKRIDPKF